MNKCPSCGETPISLWSWCRGFNWLKWSCDYCGVLLKANYKTGIIFLMAVGGNLLIVFGFLHFGVSQAISQVINGTIGEVMGFISTKEGVTLLLLFLWTISSTFSGYFFLAGYKLAEKNSSYTKSSDGRDFEETGKGYKRYY